jgi:hypothetical protein
MHNLKVNFDKILNICKLNSTGLVNEHGNVPRPGPIPRFSDLEVISLSMMAEALSIDSENLLFLKINSDYQGDFTNIISRRQYNDRRKSLFPLQKELQSRMARQIDEFEDIFTVDSKPFPVCRYVRKNRCKIGKNNFEKAPNIGYCATQEFCYYGYKLHAVASMRGVIHSFDLTKASVHDLHYLSDVNVEMEDCTLIGDKAYLSKEVQLDLFTTSNIVLEVPMRVNQKQYKPQYHVFKKIRKRIETVFSQLDGQFMLGRNYAKDIDGLFTRVLAKISAFTVLQYINKFVLNKPIGRVKHTLAT